MRHRIALFDIDGTLIHADGAGRRAVEAAVAEVLGHPQESVDLRRVDFAGRTDPWIVGEALVAHGAPAEESLIGEVLRRYARHLPTHLARATGFTVLPGVFALLERLNKVNEVALGVGTGNTEDAARAKLEHGKLHSFFSFGGFGSDHVSREQVLRIGLERGLEALRATREACEVVVIGDTPHDVTAARAIGARCIAVATGRFDAETLRQTDPDLVVSRLDMQEVPEAILEVSST